MKEETLQEFAAKMRKWAQTVESRLSAAPDIAQLHAEANELRGKYSDVPDAIRRYEIERARLANDLAGLKDQYEIIEAQLTIEADGGNVQERKAALQLALASNEDAQALVGLIRQAELDVKLLAVDIEKEERVWSDYHRQIMILATKAGLNLTVR